MSQKKVLLASARPEPFQTPLEGEGYLLLLARSFEETVGLLSKRELDLVILDKTLPDSEGLRAARDLRGLGLRLPPVLLVCSPSELEAQLASSGRVANEFLVEGFGPSELRLRVRSQLEAHGVEGEVLQMRDSFMDMLVYDLRAPLASIMVGLEYLTSGEPLPPGQRKVVETVTQNCQDLEAALQNFIDLERRDDEGFKVQKTELEPRALLAKAVDAMRAALSVRRIIIEFEGTAKPFMADPRLAQRLLHGLTLAGSKLAAPGTTLVLRCSDQPGAVRLSVSYKGQGIPVDARRKLFDRYFHREKGGWIFPRGVGLSLALCRRIVEAHMGRISVESEREDEATFVVDLPNA